MTQAPAPPYLKLRCRCGALEGEVREPPWANRALCFCASCQAFPARLGRTDDVIDERGGSDILQTAPGSVHFTEGTEHLACLRITPKGPLRWYSSCCRTPIGNTGGSPKLSFIGLIHTCLGGHEALDAAYGPVTAVVNTEDAMGEPRPRKRLPLTLIVRFFWNLGKARLGGSWRDNPFFDEDGRPIAVPEPPGR